MKQRFYDFLTAILTASQKRSILRFIDWFGSWRFYLTGRPYYFGFSAHRDPYMRMVAALEVKRLGRPIRILEIGSFRGHSALLWEEFGTVLCIDAWGDKLTHEIFKRNLRLKSKGRITWMRNLSYDGMKRLIEWHYTFDLIYIDGGHDYETCLTDLKMALPLLGDDGLLTGDDLEFQQHELAGLDPREWVETWCPGVTMAVDEFAGPVWCKNGFFAIRKRSNNRLERYNL